MAVEVAPAVHSSKTKPTASTAKHKPHKPINIHVITAMDNHAAERSDKLERKTLQERQSL